MRKKFNIRPYVGILCVLALLFVVAVAVVLDSQSPDPILGIFRTEPTEWTEPSNVTEPTQEELTVTVPDDLPPSVELPQETDPETGETVLQLPCTVSEYGLTIEKLAPYSGMYVEDGSNMAVANVAMLLVRNNGEYPLEFARITVRYDSRVLEFDITALPVGQAVVVQERGAKPVPEGQPRQASAMVVRRADMQMSADQVRVTDNGDNTLTIQNLTDETIPTVRVFYKYHMDQQDVFVGGIAFTVRITRLAPGASVTIQPNHYTSDTGKVVMVLTYDEEV